MKNFEKNELFYRELFVEELSLTNKFGWRGERG